jgi:integrase
MPSGSDSEKRNRALIACALLTGARDDALASLRLKHVDVGARLVRQDARDVRTKASKTIETWFFPAGEDLVAIVEEWVIFLREERQWGLDDPLFPATKVALGPSRRFEAAGLQRTCWSNAGPIRRVFREAFAAAGLPYFNPHSLRKTLARLGQELCRTPEEFKAWSQNLGHEQVLTTLTSYGQVDRRRQRDIIQALWYPRQARSTDAEALIRQFAEVVRTAHTPA